MQEIGAFIEGIDPTMALPHAMSVPDSKIGKG
jgi:hypothetical protein